MSCCLNTDLPPSPSIESLQCCAPRAKASLEKINKICIVALAVLAAWISPLHFVPFAAAGFLGGATYALYKEFRKEPLPQGAAMPSCAIGFFDFLSRTKLSAELNSVITSIFIAGHMYSCNFYVAFCSAPIGVFFGTEVAHAACWLSRREIVKGIV